MIRVSKAAQEQVKAYFDGKRRPVRIFLNSGGCSSCGSYGSCCGT